MRNWQVTAMLQRLRLRILIIAFVLTAVAGLPTGHSAAKADPWIRVTTRNFTLIGNAGAKDLTHVAWRLEQFRAAVMRLLHGRQNHSSPITVIVFRNEEIYRHYKPLYQGQPTTVTGYLQASDDKSYLTLAVNRRENDLYAVIFHEYVHVLTSNFQRQLPAWINEGLAEYFSTFQLSRGEDKVRIGMPIESHLQHLRNQAFMPLGQLLAVDESSPGYNEQDKKRIFYAQSWALVHYLLLGNDGRRQGQFFKFLEAYSPDRPAEAQFREAFGISPAEIEPELELYAARVNYPSEQIQLGEKLAFDESMKTEALPPAEVESYLGDLLWRINRAGDAEKHFTRAFAIDPESAFAHKTLGILYFRQGRYAQARNHLERAISRAPDDHLAQYYYGAALQWEQVDETRYVSGFTTESITRMRDAFERAIKLNPDFPDSYKQLAFMHLTLNENLDQAVTLLKKSLELAPDREDFAYTLAQVYVRQKRFPEARGLLDRIAVMKVKSDAYENALRLRAVVDSIEERMARQKEEEEARAKNEHVLSNGEPQPSPRPEPGKRFVGDQLQGMLTRIDCNDDGTTLSVISEGRTYRFYSPKSNSLVFVRYTPDIPLEITCGVNMTGRPVIVTYRKSSNRRSRIVGEPFGVEFLKEDK